MINLKNDEKRKQRRISAAIGFLIRLTIDSKGKNAIDLTSILQLAREKRSHNLARSKSFRLRRGIRFPWLPAGMPVGAIGLIN